MSLSFYDTFDAKKNQPTGVVTMLPPNERAALYNMCKIPMQATKGLPVIPFADALRYKEILLDFSGECMDISPKPATPAFVVQITDNDMAPRFPRTTFLVVEPKRAPKSGDFVLVSVHRNQEAKILFRQYWTDDGIAELKKTEDDNESIFFGSKDKIIGVITQTKFEIARQ